MARRLLCLLSVLVFSCSFALLGCPAGSKLTADTEHPDSAATAGGGAGGTEPAPQPKPDTEETPTVGAVARESRAAETDSSAGFVTGDGEETTKSAGESRSRPESPEERPARTGGAALSAATRPSTSGLKAGFADDNLGYGYFLEFLEKHADVDHHEIPVDERIMVYVKDRKGEPVPNVSIRITSEGRVSVTGKTLADGSYQFNPSADYINVDSFDAVISVDGEEQRLVIDRRGPRSLNIDLQGVRRIPDPVPLDIIFVLDTTGSMGEEIYRLKTTIELIHLNLTSLSTKPDLRFGLVLYKDRGDEYVTRLVPLTRDLQAFQNALSLVEAYGGGDGPEDLQAALEQTVTAVKWNENGIRLAFVITDAPPHLDYDQQLSYAESSALAREQGIKVFAVGTGGLPLMGEYILRQIAQYTSGKYIFLTYGETGESAGGAPGSVSHHTGENFQTDKLEAIIIRFAKEELSHLTDLPVEVADPYFEATRIEQEKAEETLEKLFDMAIGQLTDYSTIGITERTNLAVLPILATDVGLAPGAEYFTEHLTLAAAKRDDLTLVERRDIPSLLEELKLQLSGLTDESNAARLGVMLNADVIITGTLYQKAGYELFLKLLRVETAEVLSVTRAVIDRELGL